MVLPCSLELFKRFVFLIVKRAPLSKYKSFYATKVSDFVNTSLASIRTNIQNDVAGANKVIQAAVSAINKVTSIVNVNLDVPQFTIPSLDALANVTLPTGFEDALTKLNSSLPTLDQLRDKLDTM